MIAAQTARSEPQSNGSSLFGIYILALGAALAGNLLMRLATEAGWIGESGRVVVAVLSSLPLAVAAAFFWRLLRRDLDEMQQRIVLEGMAFALALFIPLAAIFVNLRTAGVWLPRLDAQDILMAPALLVALGVVLASRRYQ